MAVIIILSTVALNITTIPVSATFNMTKVMCQPSGPPSTPSFLSFPPPLYLICLCLCVSLLLSIYVSVTNYVQKFRIEIIALKYTDDIGYTIKKSGVLNFLKRPVLQSKYVHIDTYLEICLDFYLMATSKFAVQLNE